MSLLYTSRNCKEQEGTVAEIKSRIYLWNYTLIEQSIQIRSLFSSSKSELCLMSTDNQLLILDSNNETMINKHCLTIPPSQTIVPTNQIYPCHQIAVLNDQYIYTTTAIPQHGILQYNKTTSHYISQFAQDLTTITDICIDPIDNLLYIACYRHSDKFHGIQVYDTNGSYSHSLARNIHPSALSFDSDGKLHVCDTKGSLGIIKVYDTVGNKLTQYGKGHLTNPTKIIANHSEGFILVLESVSVLIFHNYKCLYSIDVCESGISNISLSSDDSTIWMTTGISNVLLRIPSSTILYRPPPPLSLLCKSTILMHLNELPISLLPDRYIRLLQDWRVPVKVIIPVAAEGQRSNSKELTNNNNNNNNSNINKEVVMKVKKGTERFVLKSLLEKRLEQIIDDIKDYKYCNT